MNKFIVRMQKAFGIEPETQEAIDISTINFTTLPKYKVVDNEKLMKMSSADRQAYICDTLSVILQHPTKGKQMQDEHDAIEAVLKAYLLDKGESIEVDFAKKSDNDNKWLVDWEDDEDSGTAVFDSKEDADKWIRAKEIMERSEKTGFRVIGRSYPANNG